MMIAIVAARTVPPIGPGAMFLVVETARATIPHSGSGAVGTTAAPVAAEAVRAAPMAPVAMAGAIVAGTTVTSAGTIGGAVAPAVQPAAAPTGIEVVLGTATDSAEAAEALRSAIVIAAASPSTSSTRRPSRRT